MTLHRILIKRIHTGDLDYGGVAYRVSHEPLVRRGIWDRVQEVLDGRHEKKGRKVAHEFAYSGMIQWPLRVLFGGEVKKGRYVYYRWPGYRGSATSPARGRKSWSRGSPLDCES